MPYETTTWNELYCDDPAFAERMLQLSEGEIIDIGDGWTWRCTEKRREPHPTPHWEIDFDMTR